MLFMHAGSGFCALLLLLLVGRVGGIGVGVMTFCVSRHIMMRLL